MWRRGLVDIMVFVIISPSCLIAFQALGAQIANAGTVTAGAQATR